MEYYCIKDGVLEAYTGREEVVAVPQGVRVIGEGAFKGCVSLKKAVLPPGLCGIMDGAFKGCRRLEEVEIPQGVTYVGSYAFHRCHALKKIVLPASVEELGDCAFLYCDSLTEAGIPGVRRLGRQVFVNDARLDTLEIARGLQEDCICDVFTGCGKLTKICFSDGEWWNIQSVVEAVEQKEALPPLVYRIASDVLKTMELDGRRLIRFLGNLKHAEIPMGIESLAKSSFFDIRGLKSVKLPETLKEIGSRAFRNCINLERIIFEGKEVQMKEDAFKNCTSLKTVQLWDGAEYSFNGIFGLSEPEIPELVRRIHKQMLGNFRISGTTLLQYLGAESRVVVPEGITAIAEEAFAGNEAIDRVILPESLEEIGAEAFRDCLLLQTIVFPEKLFRIGAGAFENCVKLIRLQLPGRMERIEKRTFRHCRALREFCIPEGVKEIGEGAFYDCPSLKEMRFPESLAAIGRLAFYRCTGLKEVRLLAGIERVESLAFAKSGVKKAWIFADGRKYGTDIFGECDRLKTLVLEEGVRHVPDRLAFGCAALERVVLPRSLESAGKHPWEGSIFLKEWLRRQTPLQEAAFDNQRAFGEKKAAFHDEKASGEEKAVSEEGKDLPEEEAFFWDGRNLEGEVRFSQKVRVIAGGAFYGNEKITGVFLTDSIRYIGAAAFCGCKNLRNICVPAGLRCLEAEVFCGCVNLEEAAGLADAGSVLPAWRVLGERSFYRCEKLREICLEDIENIGKEALAGCTALKWGGIKPGLWIGERAFEKTALENAGESGGLLVAGDVVVSGTLCGGVLVLPAGIRGIAPYAFAGNQRLTRLVLSEGFCWIGEGAFFGCGSLLEVEFAPGMQRIEARAFEKCAALRRVQTDAKEAGAAAFAFCTGLLEAVLSEVVVLSSRIFEGCGQLRQCICERAEEIGENSFCACGGLEAFDLRNIRRIGSYAFEGCDSLRRAAFGGDVCLQPYAFKDCGCLEELELEGEAAVLLREYALLGCTALRRVVMNGKIWDFNSYQSIFAEAVPEPARMIFENALSCFVVEREEEIAAYRGAGRIVKIPQGIKSIRAEAFRNAATLREIEIPECVEHIGARAFHGTAWLRRQQELSPMVIVNHMLLDGSNCKGDVTVPVDVRLVCGWAFANGLGIERIRFLSEGVRVEEYAFRNCIFLKEIVLSDGRAIELGGLADRERELPPLAKQAAADRLNCFKTNEEGVLMECTGNIARLCLADGITAVGEGAFLDGNLLTEIIFPATLKSIGRRAFSGCKWLREVKQAQSVERIGERAFFNCGSLERVELSDRLQQIGARAFENCTSLEEIRIPEGVREIPERAFYRCHALKKIKLPTTLERIGKEAFAFCGNLPGLCLPETAQAEERAFYQSGQGVRILSEGKE